MNAQDWAEIRRLYFIEGLSKRKIAGIVRMDKKTVRRALNMNEYTPKRVSCKRRPSKLDSYKKDIAELVEKYPSISGMRLYEEIRKRGYTGKITILRDYLLSVRDKKKEAYIRVETSPGEQAQVDWADCGSIRIGEYLRKLSCFVMVLCYSRLMYIEFTLSQRLECFMRCHINAFKFFCGVPKNILYDNLKSVVLARFGREIRLNPGFEAFSGYYLFKPVICNPYSGHEKGRVENGVKYVRGNFLNGRIFKSYFDLKLQAAGWQQDTANVRLHGTTRKRPVDLYAFEKDKLTPLAANDYDTSVVIALKSTKDCRVKFDANTYSVPYQYAVRGLTLKADGDTVRIYNDTTLIAEHRRSYEKYLSIEDPGHYEGLLAMKKNARRYKVRDMFLILGRDCEAYLAGMVTSELNISHHIEKILEMADIYGKTEVLGAINHALRHGAFGSSYIKNIILQKRAKRHEKGVINPISIKGSDEFAGMSVEERDLNLYDNLFDEEEG